MRFVCDSCRTQYMISDDKVGPKGVKVRCKKCGHAILVRRTDSAEAAPTVESMRFSQNPFAGEAEGTSSMSPFEDEGGVTDGMGMTTPSSPAASRNTGLQMAETSASSEGESVLSGLADDEIGAVFDQALGGAPKAEPQGGDLPGKSEEESSTQVVNMDLLRKLAEESEEMTPEGMGGRAGAVGKDEGKRGKSGVPLTDWFVAVDDQQVGPLMLDKLKDMWDRGEVGAESLCWRAGFSDWTPLSEVRELASVLAPRPAKPVIVAPAPVSPQGMMSAASAPVESAFSAGTGGAMQVPAGSPTESGGWKPSAASALASLAMQEVEALSKPPPKRSSHEEPPAPTKGLLDLPPPPEVVPAPMSIPAPLPPSEPAPMPAYNPYAAPPPPATGVSKKLIIGGIAAAVGLLAVVVVLVIVVLVRPDPQVVVAPSGTQQVPPGAVAVAPTAPAAATQPAAVAQPAAPAAPAAPEAAAPAAAPPPAATEPPPVAVAPPPVAAAPPPVKPALPPPPPVRTASTSRPRPVETEKPPAAPPPVRKPAPAADSDDEFEREFGDSKSSKKPGTGYIPPAPGGANLPERLNQSDIMSVVVANKGAIINCVNEQKKRSPGMSGKLVMRWTIQTSGKTTGISAQSAEFKSTYMATCLSGLIRGWTFPRHRIQGEPINFPFTF